MRISDWSSDVCSSDLLQSTGFAAQILNLAGGCGAGGVAGQTALTRFHELFRPGVIKALGDAFLAAQLGDAVLAAQPIENDADLVFSREVATGLTPNILHHPLSRGLCRRFFQGGLGLHLRSFVRSEAQTSELPSLMRISSAV